MEELWAPGWWLTLDLPLVPGKCWKPQHRSVVSLCALLSHLGRVLPGTSGRSSPAPSSPSLLWELSQSGRLRLTLKVEISGSSQPCGRNLLGKTHCHIEHLLQESQMVFLPFLGECTMNPLRNVTVNGSGYVSIYFILSRCFTKTIFREKNGLLRSNNLLGLTWRVLQD